MATVILFIILMAPGQKAPVPYQQEMESWEVCMASATEVLAKAHAQLKHPGAIQVGCIYSPPVSMEN